MLIAGTRTAHIAFWWLASPGVTERVLLGTVFNEVIRLRRLTSERW
jgi:hypothetical protein